MLQALVKSRLRICGTIDDLFWLNEAFSQVFKSKHAVELGLKLLWGFYFIFILVLDSPYLLLKCLTGKKKMMFRNPLLAPVLLFSGCETFQTWQVTSVRITSGVAAGLNFCILQQITDNNL